MLTLTLAAVLAEAAKDAPTDYERMKDVLTIALSFLAFIASILALVIQSSNASEANDIAREARRLANTANGIADSAFKLSYETARREYVSDLQLAIDAGIAFDELADMLSNLGSVEKEDLLKGIHGGGSEPSKGFGRAKANTSIHGYIEVGLSMIVVARSFAVQVWAHAYGVESFDDEDWDEWWSLNDEVRNRLIRYGLRLKLLPSTDPENVAFKEIVSAEARSLQRIMQL
ncbi:hypothetical protein BMR85_027460, partial [Achromobacter sp. KAs 3-5]